MPSRWLASCSFLHEFYPEAGDVVPCVVINVTDDIRVEKNQDGQQRSTPPKKFDMWIHLGTLNSL